MEPAIGKVTGMILALIFGVALMGVTDALNTSYEDGVTDVNRVLGDIGTTEITIDTDDRDEARKQMEAAIVWNAMAASDCRVLYATHTISSIVIGDEYDHKVEGLGADDNPLYYGTSDEELNDWISGKGNDEDKPKIKGQNKNAIMGFQSFEPLLERGFTKTCIGQKSVVKKVRDAAESQGSNIIGDLGGGFIVGTAAAGITLVGCAATTVVCGAAVLIAGGGGFLAGLSDNSAVNAVTNHFADQILPGFEGKVGNEPGFDMEGRYGRINFNVNKSFVLGKNGHKDPLMAFNVKIDKGKGSTPGFWKGNRMMYALPAGLTPDTKNYNEHNILFLDKDKLNKDDFNDVSKKEMLYAWRVKMVNVPMIAERTLNDGIIGTATCEVDECSIPISALGNMLDETQFLFCEGSEGYIQSNAKRMSNGGEAAGETSYKEDQVYPLVEITNGATSCLSPPDGTEVSISGGSSEDDSGGDSGENSQAEALSPISGDILNDVKGRFPENEERNRITVSESNIEVQTGPSNVFQAWQELPEGDKRMEIVYEFNEMGTLHMNFNEEATYPVSDDSGSVFSVRNNDEGELEVDYGESTNWRPGLTLETGQEYSLELLKSGETLTGTLDIGNDAPVRLPEKTISEDFRKLELYYGNNRDDGRGYKPAGITIKEMTAQPVGESSEDSQSDNSQDSDDTSLSDFDLNLDDYSCSSTEDIGESENILSIEKADGGIFETELLCGGTQDEFDLPVYNDGDPKTLEYWRPQSYLRGCSTADFNIVNEGIDRDIGNNDKKSGWSIGPVEDSLNIHSKPRFNYDSSSSANKTVMITLNTENSGTTKVVIASNNTESGKEYYAKFIQDGFSTNETFTTSDVGSTTVEFTDRTRETDTSGGIARPGGEYTEVAVNGRPIFELGIGEVTNMEIETLTLRNYRDNRIRTPQGESVARDVERIIEEDENIFNSQANLNLNEVIVNAQPAVCDVIY